MKFKAQRSFRHDNRLYARGADVELDEATAKYLVDRKLLAETPAPPVKVNPRAPVEMRKPKPAQKKAGNPRRDKRSATTGRAADRKEN